jgi:hypothetical protein
MATCCIGDSETFPVAGAVPEAVVVVVVAAVGTPAQVAIL